MVAILCRWSEQSGASRCTGGEYRDVLATHPFCGESGWTAAAGISRRYSAGTFRPSVVVTRQVALAVPIHPHRMIPVSWSGAGHSSGHRESRAAGHRGRSRGQHGAWRSTSAAQAMRRASRYVTFDAGGHNLPPRTALIVAGRGAAVAGLWGTGPASPGTARGGQGATSAMLPYQQWLKGRRVAFRGHPRHRGPATQNAPRLVEQSRRRRSFRRCVEAWSTSGWRSGLAAGASGA